MNRTIAGIATAAALVASASSFAQQHWYASVGIGYGDANFSGNDLGMSDGTVDNTDTTYGARLGYEINKNFALELGYAFLGKYPFSGFVGSTQVTGSAKVNSVDVSAVGMLPFTPEITGYARLGVARTQRKANANTNLLTADETQTDTEAAYALGARYNFSKAWALYGEWSSASSSKVNNYTLGATFWF
jgi:OmpA-OmpF porin, OOP family